MQNLEGLIERFIMYETESDTNISMQVLKRVETLVGSPEIFHLIVEYIVIIIEIIVGIVGACHSNNSDSEFDQVVSL